MTLLQFGAGNIGRGFIGQLFARAGYDVCFVDVDSVIVDALNARGRYVVEVRDHPPDEIVVEGVRAIHGSCADDVAEAVAIADVAGTAVGPSALPHVIPPLARGLELRRKRRRPPLDVIICENLRNAADRVRAGLIASLPAGFPIDDSVGLVETSIGKMMPLVTEEERAADPIRVYAEAYNTLICDGAAFRNGVPPVPGLAPKDNMAAYVDRKLFVHNLGHAACAYIGSLEHPSLPYIWQLVAEPGVRDAARRAMWESGRALIAEYPAEFDEAGMGEHIEDLLRRFGNRALGDTAYRVGRDLPRKLAGDDRLIGALRLSAKHRSRAPATELAVACALHFQALDEHGLPYPPDASLLARARERGPRAALAEVAELREDAQPDAAILDRCEEAEAWVSGRIAAGYSIVPAYFQWRGV